MLQDSNGSPQATQKASDRKETHVTQDQFSTFDRQFRPSELVNRPSDRILPLVAPSKSAQSFMTPFVSRKSTQQLTSGLAWHSTPYMANAPSENTPGLLFDTPTHVNHASASSQQYAPSPDSMRRVSDLPQQHHTDELHLNADVHARQTQSSQRFGTSTTNDDNVTDASPKMRDRLQATRQDEPRHSLSRQTTSSRLDARASESHSSVKASSQSGVAKFLQDPHSFLDQSASANASDPSQRNSVDEHSEEAPSPDSSVRLQEAAFMNASNTPRSTTLPADPEGAVNKNTSSPYIAPLFPAFPATLSRQSWQESESPIAQEIPSNLQQLFGSSSLSDVVFTFGENVAALPLHRVLLCQLHIPELTKQQLWMSSVVSCTAPLRVDMSHFDATVVRQVIGAVYGIPVKFETACVVSCFAFAQHIRFQAVCDGALDFISAMTRARDVESIYNSAAQSNLPDILIACVEVLARISSKQSSKATALKLALRHNVKDAVDARTLEIDFAKWVLFLSL
jgi:hypothetical protein